MSRCVHISAAVASRHTGCELGSPSTRRCMRSRSRYSSSEWNAARRRIAFSTLRTPSSSSISSEPVEEPMNTLTPQAPGSRSSVGKLVGVLARGAHIEREVAMHAVMPARDLVGQRRGAGRGRLGVGHLEHRRDAAQHRAARTGFQVLLVGQAGLAHVHVAVDHARQHMQAAAVDHLGGGRADIADRGDPAAGNGQIAHALAVLVDDRAALQDQVVAARHRTSTYSNPRP